MLKTFNITEEFADIIPYLDEKKNKSNYICRLIQQDMLNLIESQATADLKESLVQVVREEQLIARTEQTMLIQYEVKRMVQIALEEALAFQQKNGRVQIAPTPGQAAPVSLVHTVTHSTPTAVVANSAEATKQREETARQEKLKKEGMKTIGNTFNVFAGLEEDED